MKLTQYPDPISFLKNAQPFLERREAANSLILGIAIRLAERPDWTAQPPYLTCVTGDSHEILLAGLITPPHNLLLAAAGEVAAAACEVPPAALDLLAEDLLAGGWTFPAVNALNPLAEQFTRVWSRRTGRVYAPQMRLLIYELRRVIPPVRKAAGFLRQAVLADLDLEVEWRAAFTRESLHEEPGEGQRAELQRQIEAGLVYIWEDGGPVSTAVATRPTPHGISVGGVYTPPPLRGRGYASTCVAALSQRFLDGGKSFCALFTDADYPTSNAIYRAIGYRPIGGFSVFGFEKPAQS